LASAPPETGSSESLRAARAELLALSVLLAALLAATWPWSVSSDLGFLQRDAWFNLVGIAHLQDWILGKAGWNGPLGWPIEGANAQCDWMLGQAVMGMPLLWLDPGRAGVFLTLAGYGLTAWACHRLASALLGPGPHTWVAGVAGGLHPIQLDHAQHVNLVHHEPMVLGALLAGAGLVRRRPWLAAGGGLSAALGFHFGAYMGLHAGFVLGVVALCAAIGRKGDLRSWLGLGAGVALGLATVAPIATFYADFARLHGVGFPMEELYGESWDPATAFSLAGLSRTQGPGHGSESPSGPGLLVCALAIAGVAGAIRASWAKGTRRGFGWAWVALALVALVSASLAVGPVGTWNGRPLGIPGPYKYLLSLPGFDGFRAPSRWLGVSFTCLGLGAAAGFRFLAAPLRFGAVRSAAALIVVAAIVHVLPVADVGRLDTLDPPPVYAALAGAPSGPVYEHFGMHSSCSCSGATRLRAWFDHRRPLAGGRFARYLPELEDFNRIARSWPNPKSVVFLRQNGIHVVIDHPPLIASVPEGATCTDVGDHRICVLSEP
jgi:hypothetical protein